MKKFGSSILHRLSGFVLSMVIIIFSITPVFALWGFPASVLIKGIITSVGVWGAATYLEAWGGSMNSYVQYQGENDAEMLQDWWSELMPGWESMTEEEFVQAGYDITLYNVLNYNQGNYVPEDTLIEDEVTLSTNINEVFNSWRPIDRGTQDQYVNSTASTSEQSYVVNGANQVAWVEPVLLSQERLDLLYDLRGDDWFTGIGKFHFSYFSSGVFNFNMETQLKLVTKQTSSSSDNFGSIVDNGYAMMSTYAHYFYCYYVYTGDDYLTDSNFLNILDNYKWETHGDWFSGNTELQNFEPDKQYVLISRVLLGHSSLNLALDSSSLNCRPFSFIYLNQPSFTLTINEGAFLASPAQPTGDIYTNYISNHYQNTYYENSGNWWQGDNYGDGDVDVGDGNGSGGSGDGSLSGDLNVNVDGELDLNHDGSIDHNHGGDVGLNVDGTVDHNVGGDVDHNVGGDLDININIPALDNFWNGQGSDGGGDGDGDGSDGSSNGFWTTIGNLLSKLLTGLVDVLLMLLQVIVDVLTPVLVGLVDILVGILTDFLDMMANLVHLDFYKLIQASFGWLPDEMSAAIALTIMAVCIVGVLNKIFFK